ncbi:MAG: PilZ domain-containing protein [Acidobacteriota bacterium]
MSDATSDPRRSRRLAIPGVLVAIDAPEVAAEPWVVDGIDISADGMGLVLPPELGESLNVLLTFRLPDGAELAQVPATVRHHEGPVSGGVTFDTDAWDRDDRLALLEYLVRGYESH